MAKKQAEADSGDTTKFLFSESMTKTQEAIRKCSLCVCCGDQSDQDKYAQEVLSTEIDTLNRTIKQVCAFIEYRPESYQCGDRL